MNQPTEVVLVHGLWHQPDHFDRLADDLRGQGTSVQVPRLHRGSLAADTAVVQEVVDGCLGTPVVLGHSYGGSVITGLERVRHLVYVAAFVPAAGESCSMLGGPSALVNDAVRHHEDGSTSIHPGMAREFLYDDCSEAESAWATSRLVSQQPGHGRGVPSRSAWGTVESTYILCEQDKALSPVLQECMAGRCTKVVRLKSGHSPWLSQPKRLTQLILGI
jgi:pimeloyl-ACP methyl ester carboxylesterase